MENEKQYDIKSLKNIKNYLLDIKEESQEMFQKLDPKIRTKLHNINQVLHGSFDRYLVKINEKLGELI